MHENTVTTLVNCCLITLKNNSQIAFTDYQQDLEINNQLYHANGVFNISAINTFNFLQPDNLNMKNFIDHQLITFEDVNLGLYENAIIKIFQVDYTKPSKIFLMKYEGLIGEIKIENNQISAEVNGLEIKIDKNIVDIYSPNCRANLGDKKCKVDLTKFSSNCNITEIIDGRTILFNAKQKFVDGFFDYGFLLIDKQVKVEIIKHYQQSLILRFPLNIKLDLTKSYVIIAGCNKEFSCCYNKFNNALNFRGEPHLPGIEKILTLGGAGE
jgi:uncharacterized phage protein (TIGR02218 family)